MSDYGLLGRKLTLGIKYEDSPDTYANADVPVFMIGRQQLYELFGLYGSRKPNPSNFVCDLESLEDRIQGCNYALVCYGHWADGTPSRMVSLCNVYETLEQCSCSISFLFGLDAFNMLRHPKGVIYDYEIWQIWDDDNLWHDWDLAADLYWNDECYDNWLAEISDGPHFYPTIVKKSALMSEDYLSSQQTANQVKRCAACSEPLTDDHIFHVDDKPVCYDCWRRHHWFGARIFNRDYMADVDFAHAHYTD